MVWRGFASMLVALPSSIAFGIAIYAVLGPEYMAHGAIAGILGAIAIGILAPLLGGAPGLISAPCVPEEKEVLQTYGHLITVCELQGNLFFGTTDQLFTELEPDLKRSRFLILDLRRVQSVDFTAVHMLEQIEAIFKERGGHLVLSHLPPSLPTGQDLTEYFDHLGLVKAGRNVSIFLTFDEALQWAEDQFLEEYRQAQSGWELPLENDRYHILAIFGRGNFFGEIAFLDRGKRSADAVADKDTDLFVISRKKFDEASKTNPIVGVKLFARLARGLAIRLRYTDAELRALKEA
ncbi:MAG: cyclic nucleotide-binding domain-containing protein [Proteobacteria bacterium]|nr:cyclic nucleotide-binding domain-containing protein [Pseudomonadota bacterium]